MLVVNEEEILFSVEEASGEVAAIREFFQGYGQLAISKNQPELGYLDPGEIAAMHYPESF